MRLASASFLEGLLDALLEYYLGGKRCIDIVEVEFTKVPGSHMGTTICWIWKNLIGTHRVCVRSVMESIV